MLVDGPLAMLDSSRFFQNWLDWITRHFGLRKSSSDWIIEMYVNSWFLCENILTFKFKCNLKCDGKADFSAAITSVSHDPSEIILICWFDAQ